MLANFVSKTRRWHSRKSHPERQSPKDVLKNLSIRCEERSSAIDSQLLGQAYFLRQPIDFS